MCFSSMVKHQWIFSGDITLFTRSSFLEHKGKIFSKFLLVGVGALVEPILDPPRIEQFHLHESLQT